MRRLFAMGYNPTAEGENGCHKRDSESGGRPWQADAEPGAAARGAFAEQIAAHRVHELLHDAQSKTDGGFARRRTGGKPLITAKHPGLVVRGETVPLILDVTFHVAGGGADNDRDLFSQGRKLHGVGENVVEHLVERVRVSLHQGAFAGQGRMHHQPLSAWPASWNCRTEREAASEKQTGSSLTMS